MLSKTLMSELRELTPTDKLRAIQVLADDLTAAEGKPPSHESHNLPNLDEPLPPALENDEPSLAYRAFLKSLQGEKRKDAHAALFDVAASEG